MQSAFLTAPHTTVVRGGGPHPVAAVRKRHIRRRLGKGGVSPVHRLAPTWGFDWHFRWGVHKRRGEANQQRRAFRGAGRGRHEHVRMPGEARHQRRGREPPRATSHREPLNGVPLR
jgi:hypothetical protein